MKNFYLAAAASPNNNHNNNNSKPTKRLHPDAQRLIRECAVVNEIQNRIFHANSFELQSLRLRLEMEEVYEA